ncbi:hypothetical protein [Saccharothrix sp.]|uniref:hypothetical protein n=1 Tax=Saccharothrix sp. TaxID=1873460 RepID=UPI002811073B|nr:hypothetical protein [Saccharothrix sp.]
MTHDELSTDPLVKDIATRLAAEFGGRVSHKVVLSTVTDARRDLEGQIVPEAIGEMLHRLAHYRLDTLPTRASR